MTTETAVEENTVAVKENGDSEPDVADNLLVKEIVSVDTESTLAEIVNSEDQNEEILVNEAFEYLRETFRKHIHEAMLEAGCYLIEKFYDNDYELARTGKRPSKKESLNKLIERLHINSGSAPSKTWIYDAVRLAIDEHFYNVETNPFFRAYGKIGHSQKLRLAYVRQTEIKEMLIKEVADTEGTVTDRDLRIRIAEEKQKLPKSKKIPSIFQAIKNPKKMAMDELKDARRFDGLNNLADDQIDRLLKSSNEIVDKTKNEIKELEKKVQTLDSELNTHEKWNDRIKKVKKWHETLTKRESGQESINLPEETSILKKLRDAVQFMCFWKGYNYSDLVVATNHEYVPFEEANERILRFMLRAGKCNLKPTYNFEVTKRGKIKFLSRQQVLNRLEKGEFWLSKEKYALLSDPKNYGYK